MKNLNSPDMLFYILLIVGGLNWGLVGLFDFDLVVTLFGAGSAISRIVYVLVGISGVYFLLQLFTRRSPAP
ncbi:MAG: DUF378 domain-containing protein [Candidatus Shapirobacteria bacterium]|jgi:hypothetical protein